MKNAFCIITGVLFSVLLFIIDIKVKEGHGFQPGFILTFDDNNISEWVKLSPMLEEYGVKAVFYLTGSDSSLSEKLPELIKLKELGHEFGAHGKIHIDAGNLLRKYPLNTFIAQQVTAHGDELRKMGIIPESFAYVHGVRNRKLDAGISKQYSAVRGVYEEQRHDLIDKKQIHRVKNIFLRDTSASLVFAMCIDSIQKIDLKMIREIFTMLIQNQAVVVFYSHQPVFNDENEGGWTIPSEFLREMLDLARQMNLKSYTFRELFNK